MIEIPASAPGCDAPERPRYVGIDDDGNQYVYCRCLVCPRCGHHTGNATQGHHWRLCKATGAVREFHFCCPGDCALEAAAAASSSAPHPPMAIVTNEEGHP